MSLENSIDSLPKPYQYSKWIGVDLDGTLAHYDQWVAWNVIGDPIEPMAQRVRDWLAVGTTVKIMTARLWPKGPVSCFVTKKHWSSVKHYNYEVTEIIQDWTAKHFGQRLEVTNQKDLGMIELWDDRAIQVIKNTGRTLSEEHEAIISALKGAP